MGTLDNDEVAARLTVVEKCIVDLAILVETLRQDCLDSTETPSVE